MYFITIFPYHFELESVLPNMSHIVLIFTRQAQSRAMILWLRLMLMGAFSFLLPGLMTEVQLSSSFSSLILP